MYRFIFLLSAGLLAGNFAHAQTPEEPAAPLTLPAALALAEGGNATLSAARHELAAQGGALQIASRSKTAGSAAHVAYSGRVTSRSGARRCGASSTRSSRGQSNASSTGANSNPTPGQ